MSIRYSWFIVCLLCSCRLMAATDGFVFTEPYMAQQLHGNQHAKVFVYFCGHCPSARKWMGNEVRALHDAIVNTNAPVDLICVTPELQGEQLTAYARQTGLERAAFAQDVVNAKNISLKNIRQAYYQPGAGGQKLRINFQNIANLTAIVLDPARHKELGRHRYDPSPYSDERARALWAGIEFHLPDAWARLSAAAKKVRGDSTAAVQIQALYKQVADERQAALEVLLAKTEADFAHYEELEQAIKQAAGLETSPAMKQLKSLRRDPAIKTELKARAIYQQCQELLASNKVKEQEKGRGGMELLRTRYAETTYGALAAQLNGD